VKGYESPQNYGSRLGTNLRKQL